jgi:hypothetical protein
MPKEEEYPRPRKGDGEYPKGSAPSQKLLPRLGVVF